MPNDDLPSIELLHRWKSTADQNAAAILYDRYAQRLIGLARSRLPSSLKRRVDPHDVVLSACRSFFVRIRDDSQFVVRPDGTLWDLLAAITMHKLFGQMDRHQAARRSVARETEPDPNGSICLAPAEGIARDPDPAAITALQEELQQALAALKPLHRQMVELRLQDYTTLEIAEMTQKTDRLVRIVLAEFRDELRRRLDAGATP